MKTLLLRAALPALALAALAYSSCSTSERKTIAVAPPLKGIDVAPQQFGVDPTKNDTVKLTNGTRIYIPAGTLVDADGNDVTGSVDLNYREFHGAADILASGITMEYDSGGTRSHFASAGMFDINASAQGKPVFIKKGKSIRVDMASFRKGDNFNFYQLDKEGGNWSYKGTGKAQVNTVRTAMANDLAADAKKTDGSNAIEPKPYDGKSPVFDIDVDYSIYPELTMYKGIIWQAADASEKDLQKDSWVYKYAWTDAAIEKVDAQGNFRLKLSASGKDFQTTVKPVLKGRDYQKALADFNSKMAIREKAETERVAKEAALAAQAENVRSFNIFSFGIFNWDHQYHDCDVMKMIASFDFGDEEFNSKKEDMIVFLIAGENKDLIRYYYRDWAMFSLKPQDDNRLIAVLPGTNKVATIGLTEMQSLSSKLTGADYTFTMHASKKEVATIADLRKLVDRL